MKNEGEFNLSLSKHLKQKWPSLMHVKCSDKFTLGISDFLIFYKGTTVGLEIKYINEWPSEKAKLLKHPFSGAQLSFLKNLKRTGNSGYGAVVVKETKSMFLMSSELIPETGNWKTLEFLDKDFTQIEMLGDVESLLGVLFG